MRFSLSWSLLAVLTPTLAWGFADPTQFFDNPMVPHPAVTQASAEGVYFTGSPRFASQTCAACHTDGPGLVKVKLGADNPALFSDGYTPGHTYSLEVEMVDESRGLRYPGATCTEPGSVGAKYTYVQCNNNNMALEVSNDAGPTGKLCASAPTAGGCAAPAGNEEVVVAPGGDAVIGNRLYPDANRPEVVKNDVTRWHLWWTAPPAGTGAVTVYLALVDGNGGDGTARRDQDAIGDDVVAAAIVLSEAGADPPLPAGSACQLASRTPTGVGSALLLLVGLFFAVASRMRSRRTHDV